jgi:hypothetical protein
MPTHRRPGRTRTIRRADNRGRAQRPATTRATPAARVAAKGRRGKMMIEGAWIIAVAVVAFGAIVTVVLLGSPKLYDPDRSHE